MRHSRAAGVRGRVRVRVSSRDGREVRDGARMAVCERECRSMRVCAEVCICIATECKDAPIVLKSTPLAMVPMWAVATRDTTARGAKAAAAASRHSRRRERNEAMMSLPESGK